MVSLTCKHFRKFIYIYLIFRKFEIHALTRAVRGFHRTGEVADVRTAREIHPLRRDENFAWDCLRHRLFLMKPVLIYPLRLLRPLRPLGSESAAPL